jgi:hypothetical protein
VTELPQTSDPALPNREMLLRLFGHGEVLMGFRSFVEVEPDCAGVSGTFSPHEFFLDSYATWFPAGLALTQILRLRAASVGFRIGSARPRRGGVIWVGACFDPTSRATTVPFLENHPLSVILGHILPPPDGPEVRSLASLRKPGERRAHPDPWIRGEVSRRWFEKLNDDLNVWTDREVSRISGVRAARKRRKAGVAPVRPQDPQVTEP